jgi:uncharacterized membrane protein
MIENQSWKEIENEWRAETASLSASAQYDWEEMQQSLNRVKRRAQGRKLLPVLAAALLLVCIGSLYLLHESALYFTFAVIAWSAFLALGSYLAVGIDSYDELEKETTTALKLRMKKLTICTQILDFVRILVGVESIISCGFWIALRRSSSRPIWVDVLMILIVGVALYFGISKLFSRTRREISSLEMVLCTMETD